MDEVGEQGALVSRVNHPHYEKQLQQSVYKAPTQISDGHVCSKDLRLYLRSHVEAYVAECILNFVKEGVNYPEWKPLDQLVVKLLGLNHFVTAPDRVAW